MKKAKANILIGVCGSIAIYKTCYLIRLLVKDGYLVKVVLTPAASEFIRPLLFEELTGQPASSWLFSQNHSNIEHISLSDWSDLVIVAPLSANTLSKLASGICDNLLTSVICALSSRVPLLLAPAMNEAMWENPIIQKNVNSLAAIKNYHILSPERGSLACGTTGVGKMPEPEKIQQKAKALLK